MELVKEIEQMAVENASEKLYSGCGVISQKFTAGFVVISTQVVVKNPAPVKPPSPPPAKSSRSFFSMSRFFTSKPEPPIPVPQEQPPKVKASELSGIRLSIEFTYDRDKKHRIIKKYSVSMQQEYEFMLT